MCTVRNAKLPLVLCNSCDRGFRASVGLFSHLSVKDKANPFTEVLVDPVDCAIIIILR